MHYMQYYYTTECLFKINIHLLLNATKLLQTHSLTTAHMN